MVWKYGIIHNTGGTWHLTRGSRHGNRQQAEKLVKFSHFVSEICEWQTVILVTILCTPAGQSNNNKCDLMSVQLLGWRRHLVKAGLLSVVGADTWSLSIPTLSTFTKTFNIGRKALLTVITKCKYYEITEQVVHCRRSDSSEVFEMFRLILCSDRCFVGRGYYCDSVGLATGRASGL